MQETPKKQRRPQGEAKGSWWADVFRLQKPPEAGYVHANTEVWRSPEAMTG
jgi:hypothetical protein